MTLNQVARWPVTPEYDPWSIVTLVMKHLAEEGVKKRFTFDEGDPGKAAAELLRTLGVEPVGGEDDAA